MRGCAGERRLDRVCLSFCHFAFCHFAFRFSKGGQVETFGLGDLLDFGFRVLEKGQTLSGYKCRDVRRIFEVFILTSTARPQSRRDEGE